MLVMVLRMPVVITAVRLAPLRKWSVVTGATEQKNLSAELTGAFIIIIDCPPKCLLIKILDLSTARSR